MFDGTSAIELNFMMSSEFKFIGRQPIRAVVVKKQTALKE